MKLLPFILRKSTSSNFVEEWFFQLNPQTIICLYDIDLIELVGRVSMVVILFVAQLKILPMRMLLYLYWWFLIPSSGLKKLQCGETYLLLLHASFDDCLSPVFEIPIHYNINIIFFKSERSIGNTTNEGALISLLMVIDSSKRFRETLLWENLSVTLSCIFGLSWTLLRLVSSRLMRSLLFVVIHDTTKYVVWYQH